MKTTYRLLGTPEDFQAFLPDFVITVDDFYKDNHNAPGYQQWNEWVRMGLALAYQFNKKDLHKLITGSLPTAGINIKYSI